MKMIIAMIALALMPAGPTAKVEDLGWMAGQWVSEQDGRWTEESWSAPRGGVMLGHSRSGRDDKVGEFEFLRIEAGEDGVLVYLAQPGGQTPVPFRLTTHDETSASFENAAHDYPQRIRYQRTGDSMTATISAIDGSKAMSWTYQRR